MKLETPPMALDDVTVLDLSHALAGPFASTMLGDFGARIIKVEPPGRGDIARHWGPPSYGKDSAYFVTLHRNKLSVALDLKHPLGRDTFLRLAEKADVVLENFRVGTVQELGIDYEQVRARNPRIVYCSISGYGQDGPYRDRAAMDTIVQAESGLMSLTGEAGGRPVRAGVSIADLTAGINATIAILMALYERKRSGQGQFLDISMLEGQLGLLDHTIGCYVADTTLDWRPTGTATKTIVPYQTFRTQTQEIAIGVGSDALWRAFCGALGLDELADDPRYCTNTARLRNKDELLARIQAVLLTRTYREWEERLLAAGVPVGAINDLGAVVAHPQVKARGLLVEMEHPVAGLVRCIAPFFRMSRTPGAARTPAPLLGQHTTEVLAAELGLDAGAIETLRRAGALGPGASGPGGRPGTGPAGPFATPA